MRLGIQDMRSQSGEAADSKTLSTTVLEQVSWGFGLRA